MATRSTIAIENEDGTIRTSYCHYDGYPEFNGQILLHRYSSPEKLNALLDKGNMRCLGETISECGFYNEPGSLRESREEALSYAEEYLYILTSEGWLYSDHGKPLKPLSIKGE